MKQLKNTANSTLFNLNHKTNSLIELYKSKIYQTQLCLNINTVEYEF